MSRSRKQSLLWSVTNAEGAVSYLFGTMHIRSRFAHRFVQPIIPYLSGCTLYAGEMNLGDVDVNLFQDVVNLPEKLQLQYMLGRKKYMKIKDVLAKFFSFDLNMVAHLHPFLIYSSVTEQLLPRDTSLSLDEKIWELAGTMEKPQVGLESFDRQLEIMKEIPTEKSALQLYRMVSNPAKFRKDVLSLGNMYINQEIHVLYEKSKKQLGSLRGKMLYERNELMASRFAELMTSERVFATVGAAHMAGAKGMIRILKKKGFKLEPVRIMVK